MLELGGVALPGELGDGNDERRVGDDTRLAVDLVCQARECLHAVLRAGLGDGALGSACLLLVMTGAEIGDELVGVESRVPDVEMSHRGERPHRLAVRPHGGDDRGSPFIPAEVPVAAGDLEARGQSLHIPLERPAVRLVEVVEIEDERPLGRSEDSEVREMRVTAQLDVEARSRGRAEVASHHRCGSAVERERRGEHPSVPDGVQLRYA